MKITTALLLCLLCLPALAQTTDSTACDRIGVQYNEFDKETTLSTLVGKDCSMIKVIKGSTATYYLSLYSYGSTVVVDGKGAKIKLSNGQILSFPAEQIDVKVTDGSGYTYSAFITVRPDKLALLKKYKVLSWQLYIFQGEQSDSDAEGFRNEVMCIGKMNAHTK